MSYERLLQLVIVFLATTGACFWIYAFVKTFLS
jgi:hypothetical protein